MNIALAADHGGFELKEELKQYLEDKGHAVEDFGAHDLDLDDDYPDFAFPAAESVGNGTNEKAIMICRSGEGLCIAANKVPGVRAAIAFGAKNAEMMRRDNDANALCLAADYFPKEKLLSFVDIWLDTPFNGGRHSRRIQKIKDFENKS